MQGNTMIVTSESTELITKSPSVLGTVISPIKNYERIKHNPVIFLPMLIIFLLHISGTIITAFSLDTALLLQGDIPEGTQDFIITFTRISAIAAGGLVPFVYLFLSSSIQLFLSKLTSSDVTFKQLLSLNLHIMIVTVISVWINGLFKYFIDGSIPYYVTSLGGFTEPKGIWFGFLNGIEIFAIWHFILRAKGLQIIANFPKSLAWIIAFSFFALLLLFNIINGAALSSLE